MRVLHVVDVSNVLYAGSINKHPQIEGPVVKINGENEWLTIPSGGIAFLFNTIKSYAENDDMVFCCDRVPTIKINMYPNYKANRGPSRDEDVSRQKDLVEDILNDCGFQVFAGDGYEADDYIYSICNKYKSEYDLIKVHTRDSDLCIVVDDNVMMMPVTSNGRTITKENFETTVKLNKITKFNVVSFDKVILGDISDNIPPLARALADKLRKAFDTPFYYEKLTNKKFMRDMIELICPAALGQFDLVYPLDVPVRVIQDRPIDIDKINHWGKRVGNSYFSGVRGEHPEIEAMVSTWF